MNNETQKTITDWARQTFPGQLDPVAILKRAQKELEELIRAAEEGRPEAIGDECADVYIMIAQVAELAGQDLLERVDEKMGVNRRRRWAFDPKSETTRHVTEFTQPRTGAQILLDRAYLVTFPDGDDKPPRLMREFHPGPYGSGVAALRRVKIWAAQQIRYPYLSGPDAAGPATYRDGSWVRVGKHINVVTGVSLYDEAVASGEVFAWR